MDIVAQLKTTPLFKDFPDAELSKIAGFCSAKDLHAGETLFFEGEASGHLYFVIRGTMKIQKGSEGGDEAVTSLGSGNHFGEMAMLVKEAGSAEKRSATVEAQESSLVLEIPYEALTKYLLASPQMGLFFYRNLAVSLAGRIRRTTEDLAGLRSLRLRHT